MPGICMKDALGPRFPQEVSTLVTWFKDKDEGFDPKALKVSVEEILAENGKMANQDLELAIRTRYAEKIYAVFQPFGIYLNPLEEEKIPKTRYQFTPLAGKSEIRLFRFRKFITIRDRHHYSCDIVHANLDDLPVYRALSYVWGPLGKTSPVIVGENNFLMVTRNLLEALFRFSGANTPTDKGNTTTLLWTDQLCINQYDADERAKQVALMGRIYSQAANTRVWLGEEDEDVRLAFDLIKCFETLDASSSDSWITEIPGFGVDHLREKFFNAFPEATGMIPAHGDPSWKALFRLLNRPWFSRLWVFQEVLLSSRKDMADIVCGQMDCKFLHLYLARSLLFVDWDVESISPGFGMVKYIMMYYKYRDLNSFPPIAFTVWQIGGILASQNPRDRIYGLLGIQDANACIDLKIDYTRSVQEVYIDFTRRCIETDGNLRVLGFNKESSTKSIPDLPSWVPDWSIEGKTIPLGGLTIDPNDQSDFNASAGLQYRQSPHNTSSLDSRLAVRGRILDVIVAEITHDFQIGAPADIKQYFAINFLVRFWVSFAEHGIQRGFVEPATATQLQASIVRTLTADGYSSSLLKTQISNEQAVELFEELDRLGELRINSGTEDGTKKEMHNKLWVSTEICRGRRVAVLKKYWFMLGPSQARPGDYLVVLHGSKVPFILRPRGGKRQYEVVGQCFVDGIMYGEAVNWTEEEAETFVLV